MPVASIKKIAKDSGKSIEEVEKIWDEAKSIVDREYPNIKKESNQYYSLVMAITKNMVGVDKKISKESNRGTVYTLW